MTDESTTDDAESPAADATEPIDPARPAEPDAPDSAQPPNGGASDRPGGAGVTIPSWLAGALVVVLALLVAGAGFAIGRATAPDDGDGFRPIVASEDGRPGAGRQGAGPQMPGGPGGLPGMPGMPGEGRGGDEHGGPRVFPGERDRGPDTDDDRGSDTDDDASDQDDDAPASPQLPGT